LVYIKGYTGFKYKGLDNRVDQGGTDSEFRGEQRFGEDRGSMEFRWMRGSIRVKWIRSKGNTKGGNDVVGIGKVNQRYQKRIRGEGRNRT